jgi:hypothetical protein
MIERTIHVRATRPEILAVLSQLPAVASGQIMPAASQALQVRMGLAALMFIKEAFKVKADGGTDEAGDRWAPLSPKTIAYSRRHKKFFNVGGAENPSAKKKGYSHYIPRPNIRARGRPSWILTDRQRKRWWALYKAFLGAFHNKAHAAAAAWVVSKDEGATTIMATYGSLKVQILRDTGILFNSLGPGVTPGEAPPPVPPPTVPKQVFRIPRGEVILGTNRRWAGVHHKGSRNGHIPARPLWPDPTRWPTRWWGQILTQATHGLIDIAAYLLGR